MTSSDREKSDHEDDDEDKEEEPPEDEENNEGLDEPETEQEPESRPDEKKKPPPPTVLPKPKQIASHVGEIPVLVSTFDDRTVLEGSLTRFDVVVKSELDVNVEWRKNEDVINSEDFSHFTVISDGDLYSLLITETLKNDSGLYTCILTNNVGTEKCSANLNITGKQ